MQKHIDTINILDCPIANLSLSETVSYIDTMIESGQQVHQTSVNAAKLVYMKKNADLREDVLASDLINADGMSVIWASKFLGQPLKERVTGIDLMQNIIELSSQKNYKIFFFGAEETVLDRVVSYYRTRYSPNIIAGYHSGFYPEEKEKEIALQIANSGAHVLFVAISSPRKELFLNKYKHIIKTPFIMGVGGSFDVVAGKVSRAPNWMQAYGLEWLYRLIQEPKRMWKRYFYTNSVFIYLILKEKMRSLK